MKKLRIGALVLGWLAETATTIVLFIGLLLAVALLLALLGMPPEGFLHYFLGSVFFWLGVYVIQFIGYLVAGYVIARKAKDHIIFNVLLFGILGILFDFFYSAPYEEPLPWLLHILDYVAVLPLLFIGASFGEGTS